MLIGTFGNKCCTQKQVDTKTKYNYFYIFKKQIALKLEFFKKINLQFVPLEIGKKIHEHLCEIKNRFKFIFHIFFHFFFLYFYSIKPTQSK